MNTRVDLRQSIETEVLSYLVALEYDAKPEKLAEDRNTNFTPGPVENPSRLDPAAKSVIAWVDYDEEDPQLQNGNPLVPENSSGTEFLPYWSVLKTERLDYEPVFDAIYDLSDDYNIKVHFGHISTGMPGLINPITKILVMNPEATVDQLYQQIAGTLKIMEGRELSLDNSTLVFAIRDNGSALTE